MEQKSSSNQFQVRDIISAIFRHKAIIFMTILFIISITYIGLLLVTPMYEARVKMYIKGVSEVTSDTYRGIGALRVHITQMEIVKSNPVLERVVKALKLYELPLDYEKEFCHPLKNNLIDFQLQSIRSELENLNDKRKKEYLLKYTVNRIKERLHTVLLPRTDIFLIIYEDFSPEEAVAIANVISRSYVIFDQQQQLAEITQRYGRLHPSVQQLKRNIWRSEAKLIGEKLSDIEAIGTASVKIIEQATSTNRPIGKPKGLIFIASFIISIFVGIGIAILYDFIDQTFRSPESIIKFLNLPFLGSIPKLKHRQKRLLTSGHNSTSQYSQFYEELSDQIYIYMKVQNLKTILIVSTLPRVGNSTIVANLGLCFANQLGIKTLIIDANIRNPKLHKIFKIKKDSGLANILEEEKLIEYHPNKFGDDSQSVNTDSTININNTITPLGKTENKHQGINNILNTNTEGIIHNINPNLSLLQAGMSRIDPIFLLNNPKFDSILKLTKAKYDVIIIDCSNLNDFKDATMISSHVEGVVLVLNDGIERRHKILNTISYLRQKKANIAGVILNKRKFVIPNIIYKRL